MALGAAAMLVKGDPALPEVVGVERAGRCRVEIDVGRRRGQKVIYYLCLWVGVC